MIDARDELIRFRDEQTLCLPVGSARTFSIRWRPARAQRGAIVILMAVSLLVILGFFGLALDLSRLYNRKVEMQTVADAVALAAARELNGTTQGVTNAVDKAVAASAKIKYDYIRSSISWSDSALKFSASPGPGAVWLDAGSAASSPERLLYVKVDTSDFTSPHGTIETSFMRAIPSVPNTISTGGRAIAGPSMINVTPFAICAMSPNLAEQRLNPASAGPPAAPANVELVEYGFRRGVGYDLMQLNFNATTPANFLVNPIAQPNAPGSAADMTDAAVGPFLCAGVMAMPRVTGGTITVASNFPLAALFDRFNSRFDQFASGNCQPWAAPPDTNVRSYDRTVATNVPWMNTAAPTGQVAASTTSRGKLETVADLPAPTANTAAMYGVLWSFAKAVPFSSYIAGQAEPAGGYATFATSAWSTLYDPGRPAATGSLHAGTATPYLNGASQVPALARRPGIRYRRVLNVPLLACPVSGSSATVLGIGKFFMTMPATPTNLYAEFAGVASESSLGTKVELHP